MLKRRLSAAALQADEDDGVEEEVEEEEEEEGVEPTLASSSATNPNPNANVGVGGRPPPLSSSDRTERRRKQCRISQRRYRDKKGSAEYNLRLDINNLRESVERLKQARGLLEHKQQHDRALLTQSVRKAVEQYYVMFRHGLHDPHAGAHARKCYDIQVSFLKAFMDPAVACGGGVGVEAVLEQWRRYSRYHSAIRVDLVDARVIGSETESPIVKAAGTLSVTLNRATLEHVFPHILPDERLVHLLIGQQVEYATCTEYVFDEKIQVIRQDFTVDFTSGLGTVLRDPAVTAAVLKKALIAQSSFLGAADLADREDQGEDVREEEEEEEDQRENQWGDHREDEGESEASLTETTASSESPPPSGRLALQFIMS